MIGVFFRSHATKHLKTAFCQQLGCGMAYTGRSTSDNNRALQLLRHDGNRQKYSRKAAKTPRKDRNKFTTRSQRDIAATQALKNSRKDVKAQRLRPLEIRAKYEDIGEVISLNQRVFRWLGLSSLANPDPSLEIENALSCMVLTFAPLREFFLFGCVFENLSADRHRILTALNLVGGRAI